MLERIVYVSRAAPGLEMADVLGIVRQAHASNGTGGIGGVLVWRDGWFAQLLEGPPGQPQAVYGRICRDPRHMSVSLRACSPALCRLLPHTRLALRIGSGLDPKLLRDFDYRPGFPVDVFPADVLTEFLVRACTCHRDRGSRLI